MDRFEEIYTDETKYEKQAASAVITANNVFSNCLPNKAPIFSAEVEALQIALRFIQISQKKEFIIFLDSKSW